MKFIDAHKDDTVSVSNGEVVTIGVGPICEVLREQGLPIAPQSYYAAVNLS